MEHPGHLEEGLDSASPWYQWGPYVSERAWGSVREDYSADGDAWSSFPHDHARSRAYRWNEDGMAGISDVFGRLNLGLALWNGQDPILKERMFGLTNGEGNHGEDVKEYWWYLDAVPSSAWLRWRYHYPQAAYPYRRLIDENARRSKLEPEFELLDTGIFDDDRYWIVEVEYGKADPTDILARITVRNVGPGGGRAPRPADDLVPQRVVVGPGGRPAAALGVTRRVVAPRQPPGPRRLRPPRRGGAGRHAAAAAVLRERDQRGPHLRAAADDAVPQGRHQRPRRGRRGDRQPRRNRLEGRRLVPGHRRARRDRGAAPAPAAPAAERRPGRGGRPHRPPGPRVRRDDGAAARGGRRLLRRPAPARGDRRRGDDHAPGVRRDAVEQAVLRVRRRPLARRRSRRRSAARRAADRSQRRLAALRRLRHPVHARQVGVPVVRGLGPRVPCDHARPRRPGVREVPAARDVPGVVPAPQRRPARVRVVVRRRQPAGPRPRGGRRLADRRRARHRVPGADLPQAAAQLHVVAEPPGRRGQRPVLGRLPRARQPVGVRPLAPPGVRATSSSPTRPPGCTRTACRCSPWRPSSPSGIPPTPT